MYTFSLPLSYYPSGSRGEDCMCKDCDRDVPRCTTCSREFCGRNFRDSLNQLKMHLQTHLPKKVTCPVCNSKQFRSGADAVLHLESGYCDGCRGKGNALKLIERFVSSEAPHLISHRGMIKDGSDSDYESEEVTYPCRYCGREFMRLSSLMQHESGKHGSSSQLRIGY
jgi:hypothetical protein